MPNHLLNLGVIILAGHSLGILARYLRLPAVTGYVIAGMMLSPDGLGFLNAEMTLDMTVIESVFFMLLIAETMEHTCQPVAISEGLYTFISGMVGSILVMAFTFVMLRVTGIPLDESLLFSLLAATFAPVMYHAAQTGNISQHQYYILGAFTTSFIMWSLTAALFDPESTNRIRTALTPLLVALTSLIAGIVWGLASEFALIRSGKRPHTLFAVTALFIAYPCAGLFGLDTLFIGAGFGIYAGQFSKRSRAVQPGGLSLLATIIVFALFGARLSIEDTFMLGKDGWQLVGLLFIVLFSGRLFSWMITRLILQRTHLNAPPLLLSILTGPLVLVMVHRFGPALSFTAVSTEERPHDLIVTTTTMLLIATIIPVALALQHHIPFFKKTDSIDINKVT